VEDWGRIAEDEEFSLIQNTLLRRGQVLNAEKAPPLPDRLFIDVRARTDDAARVELKTDGKPIATNLAESHGRERGISLCKLWPRFLLLLKKLKGEFMERTRRGLPSKYGEGSGLDQRVLRALDCFVYREEGL